MWETAFPDLFAPNYVDYAGCRLGFTVDPVPADLVSRLHLIARTPQGELIVCRSVQGWRFLPGGTREPGETVPELARRELMEEAGAQLTSEPHIFAAHVADSERDGPYRPHLPHPRAYWAYGIADAQIVTKPTNPPDGEQVVEVLTLAPADAAAFIGDGGEGDTTGDSFHAMVIRLAQAMALL